MAVGRAEQGALARRDLGRLGARRRLGRGDGGVPGVQRAREGLATRAGAQIRIMVQHPTNKERRQLDV